MRPLLGARLTEVVEEERLPLPGDVRGIGADRNAAVLVHLAIVDPELALIGIEAPVRALVSQLKDARRPVRERPEATIRFLQAVDAVDAEQIARIGKGARRDADTALAVRMHL